MDKDTQEKMAELETYKMQLQQYHEQKTQISLNMQELMSAKATIENMKNAEKGAQVIIPIGGGTFIKGIIEDPKTVITSVGADIALTKDLDSAEKHIDKQIQFIEEGIKRLDEETEKIEKQAQDTYTKIETALAKQNR